MVEGVRTAAEKEERPVGFEGWWTGAENQQTYWNFAYFIPPGVAKDRVTLGMVAFDGDYLRKSFLPAMMRSEEHTSELQSRLHLVCRLLLEKKTKALLLSGATVRKIKQNLLWSFVYYA